MRVLLGFLAVGATVIFGSGPANATDGAWTGAGTDWNTGTNWSSSPDVPDGVATFRDTGSTTVSAGSTVVIGSIQFTASPVAQSYTISNISDFFFVTGSGVFNNSTNAQTFNVLGDGLSFINSSTASGGTGMVNIVNSSFLNFLNASRAGNATITNNSILQFFGTSNAETAAITNSATTAFFDSSHAGTSGTIINTATGVLTFNNSSSAEGKQIVNNGDVQFNNTSQAGSAVITNGGTLSFNNSARADHATITNNATMTFNDSSSADHAGISNNAAITFNDTSTADHATITYATAAASTSFTGLSSAGNAVFQSSGGISGNTTSFADTSTASGATILNTSGTVSFTDTATAGVANITNTGSLALGTGIASFNLGSNASGATIVNNAFGATRFNDQSLAGSASITNNAGGTTIFGFAPGSSTASADHANILNAAGPGLPGTGGITEFHASTTAGNATITSQSGGAVGFFATSSGGAARFITEAGAAFDISQLTAAGMTAGSIEGAGTYYLGSKELTVGGNNLSTTVSGILSDGACACFGAGGTGGSLVKVGSGILTLSGVNLYTGATTVNGGTLSVNGSTALSSLTTVNAGGTLAGTGIVGNTLINGGALAPGNSIGTLTVQGSLAFTAAASYMIEISPTGADRTNVTGAANLGGATVNAAFAPGSYVQRQYTILNATGGFGGSTFNTLVNSNLPAGFKASLSYESNNAYLDLAITVPQFSGMNSNQQNVANAIGNFFNATGGIPLVFATLTPAGLSQISGEVATGSQQATFDAMNLFMGLLTDPFVAGRGEPWSSSGAMSYADAAETTAYAARSSNARDALAAIARKAPPMPVPGFAQRWSVWAAGFGGSQTTDGNTTLGSNTATSSVYGTAVGADYRISPATLAGFALAGGGTRFSVANGFGSGTSDLFQAGAFVRHTAGPTYLSVALAYGWQDITTDRTVTVAGINQLRARFNANAFSGRLESGYRFVTPWIGLTPYAAAQVTTFDLPAYAEQAVSGANIFALSYASKDVTATRSELGLRGDKSFAIGDGVLIVRGRAAWAHNFNPDRNIAATFQTLPGAPFVVNGAAQAQDAALATASAELKFASGLSLAATFEGEFSDVTRSYAGKGIVRYVW